MLHDFITQNRSELIASCRTKVAARPIPEPTPEELEHGVPLFLDQLVEILRLRTTSSRGIREGAEKHGNEMLRLGFTISQVVHDYGDICQAITDLALEREAPISTSDFRTLNRCLDDAIANAVTEYSRKRDERISAEGTERLGEFAHELRNLLNGATLSFDVLRTGSVGVNGATGAILGRSLSRMRDFVNRSLAETRVDAGVQNRERIAMGTFMDEVVAPAAIEGRARGLRLTVVRDEGSAAVGADRQVLTSVVVNLLQNAFKFSPPGGKVTLRTQADADRVRIEVDDECGGLRSGDPQTLFHPFGRRGSDRSGLGLGLSISKRGVEASGGTLEVRDIPGTGCVFTVDLPRAAVGVDPAENLS
ncbi:MAG TPA: HAMP domain-containing sensor histidine kinase [Thermoanaerobaculia bacterium]|jgi:signal transduction histidine kinase|nr:HAMP domain-containing sensor histidine kinase [Thermoanaerobaculia bacterium]